MKQVIRRHVAVLLVIFLVSTVWAQQAKYVFYFIGDGMGVNQVNGAEMYLAEQEGRIGVKPLLFTTFPAGTMATTFSATNSVTDSSAAGTEHRCRKSEESRPESGHRYQCQCGPCYSCGVLCSSAQS